MSQWAWCIMSFQNGMTPLQHAAYKANCELARLLLAHGADVNCSEHDHGYSSLMFAALSGTYGETSEINLGFQFTPAPVICCMKHRNTNDFAQNKINKLQKLKILS